MKALLFATGLFALTVCFAAHTWLRADTIASSAVQADNSGDTDGQEEAVKDVFPRFSVVGDWQVTHPLWVDTLTLRPDGTVLTHRMGSTGHWILTGDGGTPVIVIRWDLFGTESVAMVSPDQFRGQIKKGRFMDMRRISPEASGEKPPEPSPTR